MRDSTGGLQSPATLVIEPDNPNQREVILFDGAFTDMQFRATSIASRYGRVREPRWFEGSLPNPVNLPPASAGGFFASRCASDDHFIRR